MGMYLAHHGGPEGIIDKDGWKLPACLFVVYPYDVGEAPGDAMVPWFWKPFYNLPLTVLLGVALCAGAVRRVLGDPSLAARLGDAGRLRAATMTWTTTAEATVRVYREVLGR